MFASEAAAPLSNAEVLYIVGGLYGNELALHEVLRLFDGERGAKRLVFNGDFHWFDADPAVFDQVQRAVLAHHALRGNVETELADDTAAADAGCGCAYPSWVGEEVVERSNRILQRLRTAVDPAQRAQLAALPMWLRADVGGLRIGIVHGDATSLAGWGFAQEHLLDADHRDTVRTWFEDAGVDVFACTHTCLPMFQALHGGASIGTSTRWVCNNGAAGMPNFASDSAGLLTSPCARSWARSGVSAPCRRACTSMPSPLKSTRKRCEAASLRNGPRAATRTVRTSSASAAGRPTNWPTRCAHRPLLACRATTARPSAGGGPFERR